MRASLICLFIFAFIQVKAQQIIVGVFDNEPLMSKGANGNYGGFFIDILEHVGKGNGWDLIYKHGTADECYQWLSTGEIDMIAQIGESENHKADYILNKEGLVATWAAVYANRDVDFNSLLDLNNKKVAVIQDSYFIDGPITGFNQLTKDLAINCEIVNAKDYHDIFGLIERGEVDAGIVNRMFGLLHDDEYDVVQTPLIFSPHKLKYGFSKKFALAQSISNTLDRDLVSLKADKESYFYRCLNIYFKKDTVSTIPSWLWVVAGLLVVGLVQLLLYVGVLKSQVKRRTDGLRSAFDEIHEQEQLLSLIYNNTRDFIGLMQILDGETYIVKKLPDWLLEKIVEKYPQYHTYQILNMEMGEFYRKILDFSNEEIKLRQEYVKKALATKTTIHFEEEITLPIGVEGIAESAMIPIIRNDEVTHMLYVARDVTRKREMVEELTRNEEKMRLAVQTVPVMLDAFDSNGNIVVWNNKCEEVTGYFADEVIGNPRALELLYPDEEYLKKLREHWNQSENYTHESVITCKDGSKRTISWINQAESNPIPGWDDWGIGIDVTDRKEAESALLRSEQQLASMMANLPGMAWRLKIDKDFTMLYVSDGVQQLLNMTADEFLKKGFKPRDFIMKEYHELVRAETYKSVEHMAPGELVIPLEVEGNIKWVLDRFKPVKLNDGQIVMDGLLIDITEKLESEQRLQLAIDGAREGMWDWDIENDILMLNQYAVEMLGFGNDKVENAFENFFKVVHPDDIELTKKALEDHLQDLSPHYEQEYRLKTKGGGWKWIQTKGRVVQRRADSTPLRAIGTHIDINERKIAEFALRDQEQLMTSMMSNLPGMAYRLEPENDFKAVFVSEGSLALFEISKEEFIKRSASPWDYILPEYHSVVETNYRKHVNNMSGGELVIPALTLSGKVKWILDRFRAVKLDGKVVLDGILIDVTDKLESEQRLQLAIEGARQGTWDWNVETDELSFNDYMAKMLGYEPEEMEKNAKYFYDHVHPDDKDESISKLKEYLRGNTELFEQEYRIRTKSGKYKWVMTRGQVVTRNPKGMATRAIGVHIDIDTRKNAELALLENERMLSGLMSNLPGMVYKCKNNPEWTILFASEGTLELTGYSAKELESGEVRFSDISLDTKEDESNRKIQEAVQQGRSYTLVYRIKTKHGDVKWVWEQGSGIPETDLLEGFITDITDRIESEERIVGTVIETEDNERKRIAKELHDGLGQKLTTAALNLNSLKRDLDKNHKGIDKLTTGLNSLNAAIRESRDIAHNLMPRSIENFGFVPSVESMLADINSVGEIDISFYQNLNGQRCDKKIEINLYRITQEAINNILKYSKASKVVIQLMKYDDEIVLTVEDDGKGFDKQQIFSTGDNFGLKSMKTRTNSLSGEFNIDSVPGKGTTITVEIPLKLTAS